MADASRAGRVCARDRCANNEFEIRAKLVLNAAGPWADYLLEDEERFPGHYERGHFLAGRLLLGEPQAPVAICAGGTRVGARTAMHVVSRAARHLFAVPWRDYTF